MLQQTTVSTVVLIYLEEAFKLFVNGSCTGGNAALMYASRYNDIQTIVNIAGRFDLKRAIEGRLGKDFREKIEQSGYIDVKNKRGASVIHLICMSESPCLLHLITNYVKRLLLHN